MIRRLRNEGSGFVWMLGVDSDGMCSFGEVDPLLWCFLKILQLLPWNWVLFVCGWGHFSASRGRG